MKLSTKTMKKGLFGALAAGLVVAGSALLLQGREPVGAKALTSVSWLASAQGYANAEVVNEFDIDANWNVLLAQKGGTAAPTYYNSGTALRMYGSNVGDGTELFVQPIPTNADQVLRKFVITSSGTSNTPAIKVWVGESEDALVETSPAAAWSGTSYTWTGTTNIRFLKLKMVANSTTQIRLKSIDLDYEAGTMVYDPITTLDASALNNETIKVGDRFRVAPTILPATAYKGVTLAVSDPTALAISGMDLIGLKPATGVTVTVTSVAKTSGGVTLEDTFTVDVDYEVVTVAEALILPTGSTIYKVIDAKIDPTYTVTANSITLVDKVQPDKTILIYSIGINPTAVKRYIAEGTISFTATIGTYGGKNQFTNPNITAYTDEVEEFAVDILTGDTAGQCNTRFAAYKVQVLAFSAAELDKIQNGTDANIANARARYLAWAAALGEKPWEAGAVGLYHNLSNDHTNINLIFVISLVVVALTAMVYFRKRKYSN
ncbi:MAG: hypothetical protein ACOX3K_04725 [Bacilli bacterium]